MYTSRSIIFMLLSFLAVEINGSLTKLHKGGPTGELTYCTLNGKITSIACVYLSVSAFWILCNSFFWVDMLTMASGKRPV
ncbi:uncharacterized protein EDB91DRAFT_1120533 [Suillus paluster]|uniref:uncharacterized protein n=1 Tax=Suillus paluster TaxID=48578 RepID=UPI001B87C7AD|nr:uncharacterized protein EDB91DRAFT_1120533 [Suillus paluster]KAG1745367.1 hypothetical protein EDB91DRAFT_1120533 [Suillus paluster]